MKKTIITTSCALAIGMSANAAITALEVGYDAPGTDSVNEYVVIYNSGPAQDLTGWTLDDISGGSSPFSLTGAGTIGANEYLVIAGNTTKANLETAWGETIPSVGVTVSFLTAGGSLPGYNNSGGDDVRIIDDLAVVQFTATYSDSASTGDGVELSSGTSGVVTAFSTIVAVPEPSSSALLGLGGLALILRRRK